MSTLSELQDDLAALKKSRQAVLEGGQSYTGPANISVYRAKLETLNSQIEKLEMRIAVAKNGGILPHSQPVFRGR